MLNKVLWLSAISSIVAAGASSTVAQAMGCNGIVNPEIAGCGKLDNNDGAQFPYYQAKRVQVPANVARLEVRDGALMTQIKGKWYPVLAAANGTVTIVETGSK